MLSIRILQGYVCPSMCLGLVFGVGVWGMCLGLVTCVCVLVLYVLLWYHVNNMSCEAVLLIYVLEVGDMLLGRCIIYMAR